MSEKLCKQNGPTSTFANAFIQWRILLATRQRDDALVSALARQGSHTKMKRQVFEMFWKQFGPHSWLIATFGSWKFAPLACALCRVDTVPAEPAKGIGPWADVFYTDTKSQREIDEVLVRQPEIGTPPPCVMTNPWGAIEQAEVACQLAHMELGKAALECAHAADACDVAQTAYTATRDAAYDVLSDAYEGDDIYVYIYI